jgi:NAD(P)-dependent dehydrogenase (short-subunit alcohol dehydrogenase family)
LSERLAGRRALVTGAAGGIGREIARSFVGEGAVVVAAGRRPEALDELCAELGAGHPLTVDVADAAAAASAVARAAAIAGGLDTVVNAAAIDVGGRAGELPIAVWDEVIAINLSGTYYVCREALPYLIASGRGSIVNITSVAGLRAWPEDAAYNASKAGVELLTRTIAAEYAADGVRANCLAPGVIDAGLTDAATDPAERHRLVRMHPIGRMGRTTEVAEAAVWLASDASSFTTGTTLVVDGGFLA